MVVAGGGDGGRVVAGRSVSVAGVRSRKCVKWSQELHASLQRGQVRPGANAHGHYPCKSPNNPAATLATVRCSGEWVRSRELIETERDGQGRGVAL